MLEWPLCLHGDFSLSKGRVRCQWRYITWHVIIRPHSRPCVAVDRMGMKTLQLLLRLLNGRILLTKRRGMNTGASSRFGVEIILSIPSLPLRQGNHSALPSVRLLTTSSSTFGVRHPQLSVSASISIQSLSL